MVMAVALILLLLPALPAKAQRYVDKLNRGLVAVPSETSGNFVSWRIFGEEYYDVTYNLYCNGSLLASGLEVSCYNHDGGNASSSYQVAAVVRGVEQEKCEAITRWEKDESNDNACLVIPVQSVTGRDGTDQNSHYALNDITLGDLTGDGIVEFIVKRPYDDYLDFTQSNCFHVLDAYDRKGNRLWWIDMGPNMLSGGDEQWDCICYDWDMDGKAEVLLRGADNMIIHHSDGTTTEIGDMTVDTRSSVTQNSNQSYTNQGNEYLLYLKGATGKPYQIGPSEHPNYMDYPNPRGNASDWGDSYGHRSTKHYFGAPYLDGHHPSIFLGRGCYTKHLMKAFDVDPSTHQLTQRWAWECTVSDSPWYGQGYHNFAIADVDWDGRDEIVFGAMVIDDSGMGLCTTGLGHGDAQHCSNFNPYRHGQQQFVCCEDNPNNCFYDATTGEILHRNEGGDDDGRALMANFTNDYPGSVGRSVNEQGWISAVTADINDNLYVNSDVTVTQFINWADLNQRIYWDGDPCDEYFDSPGTEGYGVIYKPNGAGRWNFASSKCANSSKNDPGAIADIFGDWREELVMRKSDNTAILVYTTPIETTYRIPTLWSDHQYRNSIVWQSVGYNQPPHKSYFLGEMEGITVAPPPLIMTDRTEVANGGTITTTNDHLIVCETNSTNITIEDGASPYIVTFNVPSHVTGNAGSNTSSTPAPTYEYYTCNVTGGALTGSTRLVKQGDGILSLPKVDMAYTGETNIWAGTLNFDGTLKNSPLWLNRFAELNSDGGTFRSIKADYASVIRPGGENNIGSITTDTLALGFGSRVQFDVSSASSLDQMNIGFLSIEAKSGDEWKDFGPEYLTPVVEIVVPSGSSLADGDYVLGTLGSVSGSLTYSVTIEGLGDKPAYLSQKNGNLVLTVGEEKTLNIVDGTDYLIINAETGNYLAGGLWWGTCAMEGGRPQFMTFEQQDVATFVIDSHQSNGGDYHYLGTNRYMDNLAIGWTIEEVDGGYTFYLDATDDCGSFTGYLTGAGFQTQVVAEITPTAKSVWKLVSRDEYLASMDNATPTTPVDASALIPACEPKRNPWGNSWTMTANDGVATINNGTLGQDGNIASCAESYCSTNGFLFSQVVPSLPAGSYELTAQAFYRNNANGTVIPVMYAGDETVELPLLETTANNMEEAYAEFLKGLHPVSLKFYVAADGDVTIGFDSRTTTSNGMWTIFGELGLTYYGDGETPIHDCVAEESHWSIDPTTESFHLNTWSVEDDPSGMVTPFMEYWYGSGKNLDDAVISHETITGSPGAIYSVSIDYRAFNENSDKKVSQGSTFNANTTSADLCLGTRDIFADVSQEEYAIGYTLLCQADATTGAIDINFNVKNADFDWLAFKDLHVVTFDGTSWPTLTAATGDMHTGYADAQTTALAAYEADPSFNTYLAAFNAVNAATLSALFYSDIADALAQLEDYLDESGLVWLEANENIVAYKNKTLEYCDMSDTYWGAVKQQTTTGIDITDAMDNSGEYSAEQGNGPAPYPTSGSFATETYITSGEATAGTVMCYTVTGLHAGTYTVSFYATANMANNITGDSGDGISQVYANDETVAITVGTNSASNITSLDDMTLYTITCVVGEDGILEFGIQNLSAGGNWYVMQAVSLTLVSLPIEWTLGAEYGTLILPFDYDLSNTGLTAYTGEISVSSGGTTTLELTAVTSGTITAYTPYIIGGEEGPYSFGGVEGTETGTVFPNNDNDGLKGVLDSSTYYAPQGSYVLQKQGDTPAAFYRVAESESIIVGTYHCYLNYSAGSDVKAITFSFSDETATGIEAVDEAADNEAIYDLSGRKVTNPTKGIYIVNGKKALIK